MCDGEGGGGGGSGGVWWRKYNISFAKYCIVLYCIVFDLI